MNLSQAGETVRFPFTSPGFKGVAAFPATPAPIEDSDAPRRRRQGGWQAGRRPAAHRPLKLLPLASFVWGSDGTPPRPQIRSDHVILWVMSGRVRLRFPARDQTLGAGDLHYIPAGTAFAALPGPDDQGHVAILPRGLAELAWPGLPTATLATEIALEGPRLLTILRDLAAATGPDAGGVGLLARCIAGLPPRVRRDSHADALACSRPDMSLIARFRDLVLSRMGSDQSTIAELARDLHCSTGALDRACQATQGCRAIDFVNRLRLERAFQALRDGQESPVRIAERLGYVSHAHFARACVAATGRTPEIFRAQSG